MANVSSLLDKLTYLEAGQVDAFILELIEHADEPKTIGFLNQHGYNLMVKSPDIQPRFFALDHVFRDGVGIKLACKYKGIEAGENLNGTDLIPKVVELAGQSKKTINFVLGTQSPWLEEGARALFGSNDVFTLDGFQPEEGYINFVMEKLESDASNNGFPIIVLGMGMPKQEKVAHRLKQVLACPCIIICGGAIIDFKAKRFKRAPIWMRKSGLEWSYRLIHEPTRLFKRYIVGIPLFFCYLFLKK